jgi:hypothetical protein
MPGWWQRFGYNKTASFPYRSRRYRCKECLTTFSGSFFKLWYRERVAGLNPLIFKLNIAGASNREIGRLVGHCESFVRARLSKMARWGLLIQASMLQNWRLTEPVVYDGLENFSFSQYDPNNINHAIGKDTAFTYDFNFAPMNRKGRMSERQKEIKRDLEKKFGKYPKDIIRKTSKRIFERLTNSSIDNCLLLYSDEHFQYRRAVEWDLADLHIEHSTISSKSARNFKNPLFNINNFDMQIRQKSAAFSRETISFPKHSIGMVEKFTLFMIFKNFMRSIFYKKHVTDERVDKESPAQRLGLTQRILSFNEFFSQRVTVPQVCLNEDWKQFVKRIDVYSRRPICQYSGI